MRTDVIFEISELRGRLLAMKADILNPLLCEDIENRIDLAIYRHFEIELEEKENERSN